jgi:Cu2+-exporting ATPase
MDHTHVHTGTPPGQAEHGHGHHGHGDHVAMFRRLFWWSLLLTVPIVATSDLVMA